MLHPRATEDTALVYVRGMSAPSPPSEDKQSPQITLRLSPEMLARIDRAGRGSALSRAETIRNVLKIGLDYVEGPR